MSRIASWGEESPGGLFRFSHEKQGQATSLTILVASNDWPELNTAQAQTSNLRVAATRASFLGLPRSTSRWEKTWTGLAPRRAPSAPRYKRARRQWSPWREIRAGRRTL